MNILMLSGLGVSFICLTEGLMLTISPKVWKISVAQILARPTESLQKIGSRMGFFAVIMAAIWHFYSQNLGIAWLGFAMMALMEGFIFGVFPDHWRKRICTLMAMSDSKLRQIGIRLLISGVFLFVYLG